MERRLDIRSSSLVFRISQAHFLSSSDPHLCSRTLPLLSLGGLFLSCFLCVSRGAYSAKSPQVTFEIMAITGRISRAFASKNSHRIGFQIYITLHSTTFQFMPRMISAFIVFCLYHSFSFSVPCCRHPSSVCCIPRRHEGHRCSSVSRLEIQPEAHRDFRFRPRLPEQRKGPLVELHGHTPCDSAGKQGERR